MIVRDLVELLIKFDPAHEVVIRDLNGLDWYAEPKNFREEDSTVFIDTQNINTVAEYGDYGAY